MSSFGLRLFIVCSIVHVTFSQNSFDEIISSAVQRILEGVETRLLTQTQLLESQLSKQTRLLETRLAENTRATNERMTGLEELVVNESKSSASTTEARLRENLVHTTLTVTALLQGLEQRMKNDTKSHVHDIMRHGSSIAHRLEERVTEESKISANITESLLADNLSNTNHTVRALLRHLEENVTSEDNSLGHTIEHHTQAAVHGLEGRLSASCSEASEDLRWLLSEVQNASAQVAGCCVEAPNEKPRNTSTPTEKPTAAPTPTVKPTTTLKTTERASTTSTPTVKPTTTHTATEKPTTTHIPTERPRTTPIPTETPLEVVFLRRQDGSVDFYRGWEAYKSGFGNKTGEFWLGLDELHSLTTRHNYSLRADIEDWSGETKWEEYSTFRVAGEGEIYELTVSGYNRASTAGGNMGYNNGERFTTYDRDHDGYSSINCAVRRQGAWWYGDCTNANPTGPYKPAVYRGNKGIYWYRANTPNDQRSFKGVIMRLFRV